MTPTVFTDPRLPGLELRWWQGQGEMQYWLKVGCRWVYRRTYHGLADLSYPQAEKVAKELFSDVLDRICEGVTSEGQYISERER